MEDTDNIKIDYLQVSAKVGGVIDKCIIDVIKLCDENKINVVLYHNGKPIKINYSEIEKFKKEWFPETSIRVNKKSIK